MKWIFKIEQFFRLTDPEILERRYPVWLKEFHLRSDSGGNGLYKGGDGVVRVIQFLKKLTLSVLTDRRVISPYGLHEGMISRVFFISNFDRNILISRVFLLFSRSKWSKRSQSFDPSFRSSHSQFGWKIFC